MTRMTLKELIVPSPLEVLAYFVASWLVLMALNFTRILSRLSPDAASVRELTREDYLEGLQFLNDVPLIGTAVIVIFWSGVGLLAYTLAWALINAFIEARNEVVVESEYINKGYLKDRFKLPLLKSTALALLLAWVAVNLAWIAPWLIVSFSFVLDQGSGVELLLLLVPTTLMAVNLAAAITISKIVLHPAVLLHPPRSVSDRDGSSSGK